MNSPHCRTFASVLALAAFASVATAQPAKKVDYAKDVQPIFASACYKCHGDKKQESGFRLDRKADALKGGDLGKAIVPGKSAESPLIRYVAGLDKEIKMPPKGERLKPDQIAVLRAWIDQGAVWPESGSAVVAKKHWAFVPRFVRRCPRSAIRSGFARRSTRSSSPGSRRKD